MKKIGIIIFGILVCVLAVSFYMFNQLSGTFYDVKSYKLDEEVKELIDLAFSDIENFSI